MIGGLDCCCGSELAQGASSTLDDDDDDLLIPIISNQKDDEQATTPVSRGRPTLLWRGLAIKIFDRNLCFKIKRSELRYGSKNQYYKTETIFKFQQTTAPGVRERGVSAIGRTD